MACVGTAPPQPAPPTLAGPGVTARHRCANILQIIIYKAMLDVLSA